MILFSQQNVETKLALDEFSEWDKVKYFLIPPIVTGLMGGPIFLVRPRYGEQLQLLNSLVTLAGGGMVALVTYLGIKWIFRTNESIDGKDFITRCAILSVPVFVRFALIATPCFLISLLFIAALTSDSPEAREHVPIFFSVMFPFLMVLYYALVNKSFKRFGEKRKQAKR